MKSDIALDKVYPPSFLQLWRQFYPLAMSDFTMALGDTVRTIIVGRFPGPELAFALVGIVKAIAVCLESPIIPILHASTALSQHPKAYHSLGRFTLILSSMLTAVFLLLCYQPIADNLLQSVFGVEDSWLDTARLALILMVPWPAAIACRRYFQGRLIRNREERKLSIAAMVRLMFTAGVLLIGLYAHLDVIWVAMISLSGAVIIEALLIVLYAACSRHENLTASTFTNTLSRLETISGVARYYTPLGLTSVAIWCGRAALIALIARAPDGMVAVALWTAASGFFLPIANSTRMLQHMVLSANKDDSLEHLFKFSSMVGLAACVPLVFLGFTPLGKNMMGIVIGNEHLALQLSSIIAVLFILPFLIAMENFYQGRLILLNANWCINKATLANVIIMLLTCSSLIWFGWPGSISAAIATIVALTVEVLVLRYSIATIDKG